MCQHVHKTYYINKYSLKNKNRNGIRIACAARTENNYSSKFCYSEGMSIFFSDAD